MSTVFKWIYELIYQFSKPNWDGDTIPQEIAALSNNNGIGNRVLDLGCGTGTHAIYLAQQGYTVVGVDFSSKAIALARQKARQAGAIVDFRIGDVTRLNFLNDPFDIVLDVGCFHGLSKAERKKYAQNLARLTHQGSLFLLWAVKGDDHFGIGMNPEEIGLSLSPNFELNRTQNTTYLSRNSAWYWFYRQPGQN